MYLSLFFILFTTDLSGQYSLQKPRPSELLSGWKMSLIQSKDSLSVPPKSKLRVQGAVTFEALAVGGQLRFSKRGRSFAGGLGLTLGYSGLNLTYITGQPGSVGVLDIIQMQVFCIDRFRKAEFEIGFRYSWLVSFLKVDNADGERGDSFAGLYLQPTFGRKRVQYGARLSIGAYGAEVGFQITPLVKIRLGKY